ncbi:hypothetical protein ABPG72_011431 [Tetrahymena utriculariae]
MQSWIFSGYFNDYRESLQINQSFGDQLLTLVRSEYLSIKNQTVFDCVTQVLKRALNQRTHLEVEFLKKAFQEVSFFTSVEREMNSFFVSKLLKHLQYKFIEARTEIFKAGDKGQDMYIILKGKVWEMNEIPNLDESDPNMEPLDPEVLKMLPEEDFLFHCYPTHSIYNTKKSGDYFGEISLRHGHPREFTTVTKEDTHFATISREHFNDCVALYFAKTRDDFLKFFLTFTIFSSWKKNEIEVAMLNCENIIYKKDYLIYKEEDQDQNIYFIYDGEVEISHTCDIYDKDPNSLYNQREDILLQKEELFNNYEFTSQNKHLKINKIISSLLLKHQQNVKENHILDIKNDKILKKEELQKEVSQKQRQGIKLLWQTVRVPISIIGKGESFGEEEVFQGKVRCTQARVVSAEAQIISMPLAEFKKMMIKRKKNYQQYTEYYIKNIIHNKVLNRQKQLADSLNIKQLYLQYEHNNYISDANSQKKKKKKKVKQFDQKQRPVSAAAQSQAVQRDRKQSVPIQISNQDKLFNNTGDGFFFTTPSSLSIKKQNTIQLLQSSPQNTRDDTVEENPYNHSSKCYIKNANSQKIFQFQQHNQSRAKSAENNSRIKYRILTTNNSRESSLEKIKIQPNLNDSISVEKKKLNIHRRNSTKKNSQKSLLNEIQIIDQSSSIEPSSDTLEKNQYQYRNRQNLTSFNFFYNKIADFNSGQEDQYCSTTHSNTIGSTFYYHSNQSSPGNRILKNKSKLNSSVATEKTSANSSLCNTQNCKSTSVSNKNQRSKNLIQVKDIFKTGQDRDTNDAPNLKERRVSNLIKRPTISSRNSVSQNSNRSSLQISQKVSFNQKKDVFETVRNENENEKEEIKFKQHINPKHEALYGDESQNLGIKRTYYNSDILQEVEENKKTVNINSPIIDIQKSLILERQRKLQDRQYIQEKYKFLPIQQDTEKTNIKKSDIKDIGVDQNNKRIPFNAAKFYMRKEEKNKYFTQFQLNNQNGHSKKNLDVYNTNNPSSCTNKQKLNLLQKQNEQYQNMINTFLKYNKTSLQDEISLIKNCIIQYNVDTRVPLPPKKQ